MLSKDKVWAVSFSILFQVSHSHLRENKTQTTSLPMAVQTEFLLLCHFTVTFQALSTGTKILFWFCFSCFCSCFSLCGCCIPRLLGCLWNICAAEAQRRNVCFYVPSSFVSCRKKYLQNPKHLGVVVAHQPHQGTKLLNVPLSSKVLCR